MGSRSGSVCRHRRRLVAFLPAFLLVAFPLGAQQAPLKITVTGRVVVSPAGPPQLRAGRLFLPAHSLAQELGDQLALQPDGRLSARLSHTGELRAFDPRTGEVTREGLTLVVLTDIADVVLPARVEDVFLPGEILTWLLDVSLQIVGDSVEIRRGPPPVSITTTGRQLPFGLGELRYAQSLDFFGGRYAESFRLNAEGFLLDGTLRGSLELTGGSGGAFVNFLRGGAVWERPGEQRWYAGDSSLGLRFRHLNLPIRGLQWEQPWEEGRFTFFGGGGLSSSRGAARGFTLQQYETLLVGALYDSTRARETRSGFGYGLGLLHFAAAERRGTSFVSRFTYADRRHRLEGDAALGFFRRGLEAEREKGGSFAFEVRDTITLSPRALLFVNAVHFGNDFASPQVNETFGGRQSFSLGSSSEPLARLRLSGNYVHTRLTREPGQSSNQYTYTAGYAPSPWWLPEASIYQSLNNALTTTNTFNLHLVRQINRWRPFYTFSRISMPLSSIHTNALGATLQLDKYGMVSINESSSSGGHHAGLAQWSAPALYRGWVQVNVGGGYIHQPIEGEPDEPRTRFVFTSSAMARLPREQRLQFSFNNTGFDKTVRILVTGPAFRRRDLASQLAPYNPLARAVTGSVAGRAYLDRNLNAAFDPAVDEPIADVRVFLDSGAMIRSDELGAFRFTQVPPGERRLRVDLLTVPADLFLLDPAERPLTLPVRSQVVTDLRFVQTGRVRGLAFYDTNQNGQWDPEENPAPDLRLLCTCGRETFTTTDGTFFLGDIFPGEASLFFDAQFLPPGFRADPPRQMIVVQPGQEVVNVQFRLLVVPRAVEEQVFPRQQFQPQPLPNPQAQPQGNQPQPSQPQTPAQPQTPPLPAPQPDPKLYIEIPCA